MHTFMNVLTYNMRPSVAWRFSSESTSRSDFRRKTRWWRGSSRDNLICRWKKSRRRFASFVRTSGRIYITTARSYQVLRRVMRGDRTEASLCVIRPVFTLTIPTYVRVRTRIHGRVRARIRSDKSISVTLPGPKVNCSPNATPFSRRLCFEMELRETRDLHENGAETRVTRHIYTHGFPHTPIPSRYLASRGFYLGRREQASERGRERTKKMKRWSVGGAASASASTVLFREYYICDLAWA